MSKLNITASNILSSSDAYMELFNRDGLQVYAMKGGRFQIKCGSTHKVVRNTQELQQGIDGLGLHQFPHSGESVVSEINEKLSSTYRLEVRASNDKVLHSIEGSKDKILGECIGTISMDKNMVPGRRYACSGIFGGDYMILVPMSAGAMCLDDSFMTPSIGDQMYEKQEFTKGAIVVGQNPIDGGTLTVLIDEVYPNGAFKDSEGIVWAKEDIGVYKFEIGRPTTNEDFKAPSESLYTEEDIPTYNPVGDVAKSAPMVGDLKNYDTILSASAGILSDFMKTAKGVAYIDRSSLNKVKISGINKEGQATDGEIEWNVRISSPHYKRSSNIMIPMVMKEGSIDIGAEFVVSTGLKHPLTVEGIKEHLGELIEGFEKKCRGSRYPSTLKADKDVDNLMNGVEVKAVAAKLDPDATYSIYIGNYAGTKEMLEKLIGNASDWYEVTEEDLELDEEDKKILTNPPYTEVKGVRWVSGEYLPALISDIEKDDNVGDDITLINKDTSEQYDDWKEVRELIGGGTDKLDELLPDVEGSTKVAGKKVYKVQQGIGKSKYSVSFYDGVQTHKDGSAFFDLRIFNNKKDLAAFEQKLVSEGYVEQGYNWTDEEYDKARAETLQKMNLEQQGANLYTNISEQDIRDRMKSDREKQGSKKTGEYQPKTGEPCSCRPGVQRDNCPACEGTGMKIDFKKIRDTNNMGKKTAEALQSEDPSQNMGDRIKQAFAVSPYASDMETFDSVYEHGHWWISGTSKEGETSQFDAVDAEGQGAIDGFDFEKVASKKTAETSDNLVEYYFTIRTDLSEDNAKEDGLDTAAEGFWDAATQAALKVEQNVQMWMEQNIGHNTNTGHDNEGLVGSIYVERGSNGHKFVMSCLEDNKEEPARTSSGTLPFDPFDGVEDKFAGVIDVDLSFMRVENLPPESTPDYSNEPEPDYKSFRGTGKEGYKKTSALPSGASAMYDEKTGEMSLHDRGAGWISPELSPPAAYAVGKAHFGSWEEFKKEYGVTKMRPIDFNDKYYIVIGGRGGSSEWSDMADSFASDDGTMEVTVNWDKLEDAVIEKVWGERFGTEDPDAVGGKVESWTYEDKDNDIAEAIADLVPQYTTQSKTESKKVLAFDFTQNQDLKVGDTVLVNGKEVKITNLHRVQDVYSSEEDFNAYQDIYQNSGLTWEGNQIMSVDVDSDGIEVEHFVYEVEKQGAVGAKKVAMEPGHGFQVEAEPGRYYTGTFTDWMNGGKATPFAVANADEIPPSSKDIKTIQADSAENAVKVRFGSKIAEMGVPDQHQLKILKDTVRNPNKGLFLGGPSAEEAEQTLRTKFNYTDKQIEQLKTGSIKKADTSDDVLNSKTLDQLKAAVEALGYTVDENDVITASGRFEAEHISTVFYNEGYMTGDQGEDFLDFGEGETVIFYKVTPEEQKMFSTTEPYFALTSSTQGFIGGAFVSEEQHKESVEEYEKFETESGGGEEGMPLASKKAGSQAWDVVLDGKVIDTVYDVETDPEEIKRSLVSHDGYDPNIVVQKRDKNMENISGETPEQLAESFINGNISFVKEHIGNDAKKLVEVMNVLKETGSSEEADRLAKLVTSSVKTSELVAVPDLAAFRENPDDFGVPAEIAQNWTDDEIKVYLEEKLFANEHYPALANKVTSDKVPGKEYLPKGTKVQMVEGDNDQRTGEILSDYVEGVDEPFADSLGDYQYLLKITELDGTSFEAFKWEPAFKVISSKTSSVNPQAKYAVMSTFNGPEADLKTSFPDVNFGDGTFDVAEVNGSVQVDRITDGNVLADYLNKIRTDKMANVVVMELSDPDGSNQTFDGWGNIDASLLS